MERLNVILRIFTINDIIQNMKVLFLFFFLLDFEMGQCDRQHNCGVKQPLCSSSNGSKVIKKKMTSCLFISPWFSRFKLLLLHTLARKMLHLKNTHTYTRWRCLPFLSYHYITLYYKGNVYLRVIGGVLWCVVPVVLYTKQFLFNFFLRGILLSSHFYHYSTYFLLAHWLKASYIYIYFSLIHWFFFSILIRF